MFLFEKKIIYLTFFWDGIKKSSAGFAKISRESDACRLDIHIRHIDGLDDGKYALYLVLRDQNTEWRSITVKNGAVNEERCLPLSGGKFRLRDKEFEESELCGILIRLDEHHWISGYWQETENGAELSGKPESSIRSEPPKKPEPSKGMEFPEKTESSEKLGKAGSENNSGADLLHTADDQKIILRPAPESKWEQLQRSYRRVHPFGDERLYLAIEPKDFIVLQASYQRLVNNSFLLHGYYNYRHLILGPDEEIGTRDETCFYLGVPGTYFEREKMVAVMFGFEGFECAGPVEIGKFGYYMRRVEL